MKTILITGSGGLIGSACVEYFKGVCESVIGIDNNTREKLFGKAASIATISDQQIKNNLNFQLHFIDIVDRLSLDKLFRSIKNLDAVIHCAAQPSHDWAAQNPLLDFQINALGTLNLLELTRKYFPEIPFVHMSTNKVYGDNPNKLSLTDLPTRFEFYLPDGTLGSINENMSIDQTTHSLFGVSKTSGDLLVQEYGNYFGMKTVSFRGGCLTGPQHKAVKLHGFMNFIVNSFKYDYGYEIIGYQGKQVRDNIHAQDVVQAINLFIKNPKIAAVYNLGGGRENSVSIIELINKLQNKFNLDTNISYKEQNRIGDHKWYISDLTKFKNDYPAFKLTKSIDEIITEILAF
jgi:CDP-paratose 2-epimerase